MSWSDIRNYLLLAVLLTTSGQAADYVLAGGIGIDDNSGYSISALGDVAIARNTWLGFSGGFASAETFGDDIETRTASISLRQEFGAWGLAASAGVWGDKDALDSKDFRLGVDYQGKRWRIGVDAERRDFDLTFGFRTNNPLAPLVTRRSTTVADGVALRLRYKTADNTRWFISGRRFDYDRDLDRLTDLDLIRRLVPTTLILADGLRDTELSAGVEWEVGEQLLGIEVTKDEYGVGDVEATSIDLIWTRPVGLRSDLELSLGISDSEQSDSSVILQAFWYFFGGA